MQPLRGASYNKMAAELASAYKTQYPHFDRVARLLKDLFEHQRLAAALPSYAMAQVLRALVDQPNYGAGWWTNKDLTLHIIVHEICRFFLAMLEQPTPFLPSPSMCTPAWNLLPSDKMRLELARKRCRELLSWTPAELHNYIDGLADRPAIPVLGSLGWMRAERQLAASGAAAAAARPAPMV